MYTTMQFLLFVTLMFIPEPKCEQNMVRALFTLNLTLTKTTDIQILVDIENNFVMQITIIH